MSECMKFAQDLFKNGSERGWGFNYLLIHMVKDKEKERLQGEKKIQGEKRREEQLAFKCHNK